MHSPKAHECGVIAESDTGESWQWAATRRQASEQYAELLDRLQSKTLATRTTVSLVHQGRVVDETVLSATVKQA
jgi:hypothetical protein